MVEFEFKTQQSKDNWSKYKMVYIALLIFLIIAVLLFSRMARVEIKASSSFKEDGDGSALLQGRGSDSDSTEVLLNRLQWSTYYESKITRWYRMLVVTVIVIVLISILALRKLPKPSTILILFLCIFIPVYATHNFYYTHGDIYNDYYMWENIQRLRKRLYGDVKYKEPFPTKDAGPPDRVKAMNEQ